MLLANPKRYAYVHLKYEKKSMQCFESSDKNLLHYRYVSFFWHIVLLRILI